MSKEQKLLELQKSIEAIRGMRAMCRAQLSIRNLILIEIICYWTLFISVPIEKLKILWKND